MIFSGSRFPPRIKSGVGFSGSCVSPGASPSPRKRGSGAKSRRWLVVASAAAKRRKASAPRIIFGALPRKPGRRQRLSMQRGALDGAPFGAPLPLCAHDLASCVPGASLNLPEASRKDSHPSRREQNPGAGASRERFSLTSPQWGEVASEHWRAKRVRGVNGASSAR